MASSSGSKSTGSKLGFKLTVDGEREYKQTCDNIKQSLKVLGSELKLASAEFAGNADSVDALRTKQEILTRQYGEHQKAVEENEKMLARLRAEENQNTDAIAKYEIALNNSKTELIKTGNQLEATEKQLNGTASEADNFGKEVKKSTDEVEKSGGSLSSFGETIAGVGKAFAAGMAAIGGAAVAAGKSMFDMATGATEAGDRVDKMSQKLGMSAEGFQEWDYILGQNGASIDSLGAGMKTLTKTLDGLTEDGDKASEAFKAIGIDFDDIKNKSPEEAFNMTIAALQEMPNGAEKTAAALKLLGKQGMELAPLLNSSAEATEELRQNAHTLGIVMSNETVSAAATFGDSMDDLKAGIGGFKNMIGAEFLPGLTLFTQGLTGILTGDEGAGALMKEGAEALVQNIADVIPTILGVISNMASVISEVAPGIVGALVSGIVDNLPGLTEAAGTILSTVVSAITDALPLLIEGAMQLILTLGNGIVDALPYFAPKVVEILTFLVKTIADNLPMIAKSALSLITGLADGLISSVDVLLDAVPEIISSLIDSILNMIPEIITAGVNLFTSLIGALPEIISKIVSVIPLIIDGVVSAVITALPLLIDAGISLFTSLVEALPQIITSIVSVIPQIINSIISAVIEALPLMINAGIELLVAIIGALPEIITAIVGAIPQIIDGILTAIVGNIDKIIQAGVDLFIALVENLPVIITEIVKAVPKIVTGIVDSFKGLAGTIKEIGSNILAGIWEGIASAGDWLKEKISGFFGGVVDGIKDFFGIKSPSQLFKEQIGKNIVLGLVSGIDENSELAKKSAENMSKEVYKSAKAWIDNYRSDTNYLVSEEIKMWEFLDEQYGSIAEHKAEIDKNISKLQQQIADENKKAFDEAVKEMIAALKNQYKEAYEVEQYELDRQVQATKKAADEKISEYRREHDEKIKLIDEASQAETNALRAKLNALNEQDQTDTSYENTKKLIELNQAMMKAATGGGDYQKAKEAYDAEVARQEKEKKDAQLKSEKEFLTAQIKGIEEAAKLKIQLIQEEQDRTAAALNEEIAYRQEVASREVEIAGEKNIKLRQLMQEDLDEFIRIHDEKKATASDDTAYAEFERMIEELERQLSESVVNSERVRLEKQLDELKNFREEFFNEVTLSGQQMESSLLQAQEEINHSRMKELKKQQYAELNQEENLQAEARRVILQGSEEEIISLLSGYNEAWKEQGKNYAVNMTAGLKEELSGPAISQMLTATLSDAFTNGIAALQSTISGLVTVIADVVSSAMNNMVENIRAKNDEIIEMFAEYAPKWFDAGAAFVDNLTEGANFQKLVDKARTAFEEIWALISEQSSAGAKEAAADDPWSNLRDMTPEERMKLADSALGRGSSSSSLVVNINQPVESPAETAREIKNAAIDMGFTFG